jgi:hypothetical protein
LFHPGYLGDLIELDPSNLIWTKLDLHLRGGGPSARASHGVASFQGKIFIFGGYEGSGVCSISLISIRKLVLLTCLACVFQVFF